MYINIWRFIYVSSFNLCWFYLVQLCDALVYLSIYLSFYLSRLYRFIHVKNSAYMADLVASPDFDLYPGRDKRDHQILYRSQQHLKLEGEKSSINM